MALLGGQREVRLAAAGQPAHTRITWSTVMGVQYPVAAEVIPTAAQPSSRAAGTAATPPTREAYQAALDAALAYAAEALRAVEAEVAATAQRFRAISDRWLPHLRSVLDGLAQRLEETERDETTRLRWAAGRSGRPGAAGHP
jgi:V/A-type H+/Na+-transporting ATPase subunit D